MRFSLYTKILLWFFLNLVVLGAALLVFINTQFRLSPDALLGEASSRVGAVANQITYDISQAAPAERTAILNRYAEAYQVDFLLYANDGTQLGGRETTLPSEVLAQLIRPSNLPAGPPDDPERRGPPPATERRGPPPQRRHALFSVNTDNPTRYWVGARVPVSEPGRPEPIRATLLAVSDSRWGRGLFFDPAPWAILVAVMLGLSLLLWLPFVRSLTRTIKQISAATEQIAEERFDIRVDERRSDELGRLGKAINQLAARLAGFVTGQKRFLGDISHELNSPLGRLQLALGVLEARVDPAQRSYVADAQEEVELMSQLVSELLAYAKAGIRSAEIELTPVKLLQLVERVIDREASGAEVKIEIDENLAALAQAELLARALANVIRNAARYASAAGPIRVVAERQGEQVKLAVIDGGPGVPEEALSKLFDPFYRLEPDRARQTGGAGLGLAIVKTCVESCRGSVGARKLKPSGFEVTITLQAAP
jgi:two-component system sensor histidine kinase CpxA